jgi:hypothetical protein
MKILRGMELPRCSVLRAQSAVALAALGFISHLFRAMDDGKVQLKKMYLLVKTIVIIASACVNCQP